MSLLQNESSLSRRLHWRLVVAAILSATAWLSAQGDGRNVYTADPPRHLMVSAAAGVPKALPTPSQCVAAFGLACYTPQLMRKAYNIPDAWTGRGQTIVIVDAYGSPTIQDDLATFSAIFSLPNADLEVLYPEGKPKSLNPRQNHDEQGWAFETTLDVEWAHAIAPDARLVLVIGPNNFGTVMNNVQRIAVDQRLGDVMSLSFGGDEAKLNGNGANNLQQDQAHQIYSDAAAANMTVFASAGDGGATDGFTNVNPSYPGSDPLVTSVGGTNLFITDAGAYLGETVWNDGDATLCPFGCTQGIFGATGGAPSILFAAPPFQSLVTGSKLRLTSDVAYNASVYTGVLVYVGFFGDPNQDGLYFVGGTSAGTPQWAGVAAILNQATGRQQGYFNPALYAIGADATKYAQAFHDVTIGNNALNGPGFPAGPKYDLPTGLGSPNVAGLINVLK